VQSFLLFDHRNENKGKTVKTHTLTVQDQRGFSCCFNYHSFFALSSSGVRHKRGEKYDPSEDHCPEGRGEGGKEREGALRQTQQETEGKRESKAKTVGKRKGEPSDWKRESREQKLRGTRQKKSNTSERQGRTTGAAAGETVVDTWIPL